ncbi:DUF4003 family protein [uncultured Clostridium sp.]|uniref:DUF4003 family protein n=1 Tax=uncultured Clostridium sp. TaxID=59620 RepID=UPI0026729F22|nr:DUF4003 family protein [uncultured Clostridium sp.]
MNEKITLFLENNRALEDVKGSWGMYGFQIKSSALTCTMKNQRVEVDKINLALDTIKKNTSMFSNFRGINKLTTAITISFEDDMEGSLKEIISIYENLKDNFFPNEYLVMAAQVIFNARYRVNVDDAVKNTRVAYDYMKKHHRFLTGQEDIANAAIIATTSSNLEETFKEIEESYQYLKDNGISYSNNIQSLSHILSLINLPSRQKCDEVLEMNSILKENKVPVKDYLIPMLGIITFLTDNKKKFAENISDISIILKKEKGFGNFALGANFRNMISATLVSLDYLENIDSNVKENIISNTNNIALTVAIAMQTAVIVSSAAAASAASASSSSS